VNLGQRSALASLNITLPLPSQLGPNGAVGGKSIAMETEAPFSSPGQDMAFTVQHGFDPSTLNSDFSNYVSGIPNAQSSTDNGGGTGWMALLHSFPAAGTGGVITNNSNELVIPTSNSSSYTNVLASGGDNINGSFPSFSVADAIPGSPRDVAFWRAVVNNDSVSATSTLLGNFHIVDPPSTLTITFLPVPEPAAASLVAIGLVVLAWSGRRRRTA
jgi:hypothetical protein